MARRKPAKKAGKKSAAKASTRKSAKKTTKQAAKKAKTSSAKAARGKKPATRATAKKAAPQKKTAPQKKVVARKAGPPKKTAPAKKLAAAAPAARTASAPKNASAPKKKPNLDRPRKTVADVHGIPSSLDLNRAPSAARSGRAEMRDRLSKNTGAGPALTGGDVDADWQSAESIGDEAPGGDNPTPDQDVVDDIGRSLGVEYADDEELQGGAEISERDHHRWELDPSSKDDFDDEE
jgi:hypothetical protein